MSEKLRTRRGRIEEDLGAGALAVEAEVEGLGPSSSFLNAWPYKKTYRWQF